MALAVEPDLVLVHGRAVPMERALGVHEDRAGEKGRSGGVLRGDAEPNGAPPPTAFPGAWRSRSGRQQGGPPAGPTDAPAGLCGSPPSGSPPQRRPLPPPAHARQMSASTHPRRLLRVTVRREPTASTLGPPAQDRRRDPPGQPHERARDRSAQRRRPSEADLPGVAPSAVAAEGREVACRVRAAVTRPTATRGGGHASLLGAGEGRTPAREVLPGRARTHASWGGTRHSAALWSRGYVIPGP